MLTYGRMFWNREHIDFFRKCRNRLFMYDDVKIVQPPRKLLSGYTILG